MSNSLKMLYNEHDVISKAAYLAKNARELIGINDEEYELTISELMRFFRIYADQYHHHKEEEILFPAMAQKSELLAQGILKEMLDNHAEFREMAVEIYAALEEKDYILAADIIDTYTDALLDHIAVENEELFQTAYSLFTEDELDNIYFRFIDLDSVLGESKKKDFTDLLKTLNSHSEV